MITVQQLRYLHELIGHIAEQSGYYSKALLKEQLKSRFAEAMELDRPVYLKKDGDQKEYHEFLRFVLDIGIDYGVLQEHPIAFIQDIEAWVAYCMDSKRCCVTGTRENVGVHFVDRVYGSYIKPEPERILRMPLTFQLHQEIHDIGYHQFIKKYPTVRAIKCSYWLDAIDIIDESEKDNE